MKTRFYVSTLAVVIGLASSAAFAAPSFGTTIANKTSMRLSTTAGFAMASGELGENLDWCGTGPKFPKKKPFVLSGGWTGGGLGVQGKVSGPEDLVNINPKHWPWVKAGEDSLSTKSGQSEYLHYEQLGRASTTQDAAKAPSDWFLANKRDLEKRDKALQKAVLFEAATGGFRKAVTGGVEAGASAYGRSIVQKEVAELAKQAFAGAAERKAENLATGRGGPNDPRYDAFWLE